MRYLGKLINNKQYQGFKFQRSIQEYEGNIKVSPALSIPSHIQVPDYILDPKSGFGIYEGRPTIHSESTIEKLRKAAIIASDTLSLVQNNNFTIGNTTEDIDKLVHDNIIKHNAYPTPIGFMNFPKSVCTSVNDVLCHGIPNNNILQNGDSVNVDVTCYKDGVHGDSSVMICIGEVREEVMELIIYTQQILYQCISQVKEGNKFSVIAEVCQEMAGKKGYYVSDLFTGHGIGNKLHMPPMIHHTYNIESQRIKMEVGNVFTIEPIVLYKRPLKINWWQDGFTVVAPNIPSAQWEHTVALTNQGVQVITRRKGEVINTIDNIL